jgi:hypothetical protein
MLNRRSLITGLISLVAAPAIVRATSIMPIKALPTVELDTLVRKQPADYLIALTRQAFVPRLFVSVYRADLWAWQFKYLDARWEP